MLRSSLVYAVCSRPAKATKQDPVSTAKQEQRDEREAREGEREKQREADFPFHLTERQRPTWRQSSHRACEASAWRAAPRPHTHTHTNCLLSSLASGLRLCTDSLESPLCCKFCSSRASHETTGLWQARATAAGRTPSQARFSRLSALFSVTLNSGAVCEFLLFSF